MKIGRKAISVEIAEGIVPRSRRLTLSERMAELARFIFLTFYTS